MKRLCSRPRANLPRGSLLGLPQGVVVLGKHIKKGLDNAFKFMHKFIKKKEFLLLLIVCSEARIMRNGVPSLVQFCHEVKTAIRDNRSG